MDIKSRKRFFVHCFRQWRVEHSYTLSGIIIRERVKTQGERIMSGASSTGDGKEGTSAQVKDTHLFRQKGRRDDGCGHR